MAALVAAPARHCALCELEPDELRLVREVLRSYRQMGGRGVLEIRKQGTKIELFRVRREGPLSVLGGEVLD